MPRLRQLLDDPDLDLVVLVGGDGLDREIRWAHVTELPDPTPYVGAEELVLTNGLWLAQEDAEAFVGRLAAAGAVGLVFGLRTTVPEVPPPVVEACRRQGLPLASLPVEVPFTAVTRAVAAATATERQRMLLDTVRRTDALTAAVSSGDGLRGVLRVLAGTRQTPVAVAVVDRLGQVLDHVGPVPANVEAARTAAVLNAGQSEGEVELASGEPATVVTVTGFGSGDLALLYGRAPAALTESERAALTQTVRFVTVELGRRQAVRAIEARFATEIVDLVLAGPRRDEELAARLRSFGLAAEAAMAVFVVRDATDARPPEVAADVVAEHFVSRGLPAVAPTTAEEIVAIVGLHTAPARLPDLAAQLVEALRRRVPGADWCVGAGRIARDHQVLRQSLVQAREACRMARVRGHERRAVTFDEVGSYRMVLASLDERARQDFARTVLGPALDYDREHRSGLVDSLATFLACGGRWSEAATRLHVHVNTLRNRLAKLEQLTDRDLSDTGDRTDLFLALRVLAPEP
ncbi:PucR family transcriptional regulator [Streptoalloteichus hindustanus]|uniref:PucR C-terminal helix-turn-helix domain-containing protein n=1 Tax=Streptoalloteichus hindustanus TaxID=2017 RepID=A0A1M5DEK7_STRHI|nr:PucR family transcriptional regulator ligand-binding domain-containing protein [Streptoalloteichus hindustanus]SHF65439.1 PucR C-terminal helix-turn-helix domain-containing protein [Streptoalloteichus hindustanus]